MYHRRWKYHEAKAPKGVIVNNEKEEAALGDGWVDTPADFGKKHYVPSLEEVIKAGYSPEATKKIVAREQAIADGRTPESSEPAVPPAQAPAPPPPAPPAPPEPPKPPVKPATPAPRGK